MEKFYRLIAFTVCVWGLLPGESVGQELRQIKMKDPVICYGHTTDHHFVIPPPAEYLLWKAGGARVKTSTIEIIFNDGFTQQAMDAFRAAADIWEGLISSSQTITIDAYWTNLGSGVLGGALYTSAFANFNGAQKLNVFYPVALAEKISGQNLNDDEPEIFTQFSSSTNWHYNPETTPPQGTYDLVTIVLHEIGHGLGLSGSFSVTGSQGAVGVQGTGVPIIYDVPIENVVGANLIETFASPSTAMATELTNQGLFFNTPTSTRPRIFAPASFNGGSSISHLDENTYNSTAHSLMTPFVAPQEKMHSPGLALNMLQDMGWEHVRINHQPLPSTESVAGPFVVTVTLLADNGYQPGSVKLNHTLNGITFTPVTMTPTGNPNEFTATIPTTNAPQTYGYFISVMDNSNREFVNPGKIVENLEQQLQDFHFFETGPDTDAPVVGHSPKPFLLDSDTEVEIDARVTDNIALASVTLEYRINGGTIVNQPFTLTPPGEDSIYLSTIDFGGTLTNGSTVEYRIRATDMAMAGSNQTLLPTAGFFTLNVVGLEPTQNSYENNFNSPSADFFGNGFSIITPAGFSNGAIHSDHPYDEGDGFPNDEFNLIYQLKIPVRVKEVDATVKFDEIVLVEPGETGSVFGSPDFFDYVVVEGSKDGGLNWTPVAPGYDARDFSQWLTQYNSSIVGNNSTATGDPTLYRSRTIDLQVAFDTDDEVVIRFRLFSDPFAAGWGWAIDNLRIQIDEIGPVVLSDHLDFLEDEDDVLSIITKVSDGSGIQSLKIEYSVNNGTVNTVDFIVDPPASQYTFTLDGLSVLPIGDDIQYRIVATDSAGNEGTFPPSGNFLNVPIIAFGTPLTTYANNFNSANSDFVGNFFSVSQPIGFTNGAIHSDHPYANGLGLDQTSSFSFTLVKPITIGGDNSYIRFDEIAIVEPSASGVVFGNPNFKDYVIVEGSKDGGQTWLRFLDGYNAREQSVWLSAFNASVNGNAALFRTRAFDMTENGNFDSGDEVIVRFRFFSTALTNGWGWAIDNLYIQDAITATENEFSARFRIYPNPVQGGFLKIEADVITHNLFQIDLVTLQGQQVYSATDQPINGRLDHTVDVSTIPAGLYVIKVESPDGVIIRKVVKSN